MDILGLYDSLTIEGIEAFVADGQEEHLHLDFKIVNDSRLTNRDDRKNLAKALSGFANSDGGLIVWGIDCRKDDTGRDVASGLRPIPEVMVFLTHLNSLTPQSVSPSVEGVRHRALEFGRNGHGFAITFIPASLTAPHMAKGGEDRYYKRSGDSFLRMEHFEVSDMFGSRQKPFLTVYHRIGQAVKRENGFRFKIIIGIRNSGRGSARDPFLALRLPTNLSVAEWGIDGNGRQGLRQLGTAYGSLYQGFSGAGEISVHPGMDHDVTALEFLLSSSSSLDESIVVGYRLAAEWFPLTDGTVEVQKEEILEVMRTRAG